MKGKLVNTVVVGVGMAGRVRIRDVLHLEAIARKSGLPVLHIVGYLSRPKPLRASIVDKPGAYVIDSNRAARGLLGRLLALSRSLCLKLSPAQMCKQPSSRQKMQRMKKLSGRVLHVEHIELLTSQYKQLRDQVEGKTLEQGCLHFTGGPLMDFEKCGFPSFTGVSHLSWLVNLFGELQVEAATMEERRAKQYFQLRAKLLTKTAGMLTWVEERRPGYIGAKRIQFQFVGGSSLD